MACELSEIQEGLCESGIGRLNDQIKLLQVIAQSAAVAAGEEETSVDELLEGACLSGIGLENDPIMLLKSIAQSACTLIT